MSRSARCALLIAVLVFHGLAVVFLVRQTATRFATRVEDIVSTQILMPEPLPPPVPEEPTTAQAPAREPQIARTPAAPRAESGPIGVEPAEKFLPWIDWQASAERAAAAVTQPSPYRRFGRPDVMPHGPVRSPSRGRPIGEVYRDDVTGQVIRWLSEDCYQILGSAAPLGVPVAGAESKPAPVLCSLKSRKPRGDLFKDLPAYKRHLLPESRQR